MARDPKAGKGINNNIEVKQEVKADILKDQVVEEQPLNKKRVK